MDLTLANRISTIEKKWLPLLYSNCRKNFSGIHLPSHDHRHHFRVWFFAKELIKELNDAGRKFGPEEIEQLIIATFFHDQGMSKTLLPEHGAWSRDLCAEFLLRYPPGHAESRDRILQAVHYHENKNYTKDGNNSMSLLSLLNMADDLDAFGRIGVYRYIEIYLLREISISEIHSKVLVNIEKRFAHFEQFAYTLKASYKDYCHNRFHLTRDFFKSAEGVYSVDDENYLSKAGVCKISEEIKEFVVLGNLEPQDLAASGLVAECTRLWWNKFTEEWNMYQYPDYE